MSEKTYRIEELVTTGWELVEPAGRFEHLTKQQASEALQLLIDHEEKKPTSLRAIPDGTTT